MKKFNRSYKLEILNVSEHSYTPAYFESLGQKKIKGLRITRSFFDSKTYTDLHFLEGIQNKSSLKVLFIDVGLTDNSAIERLYMFENLSDLSITNSRTSPLKMNLEKFPYLKNLTLAGNFEVVGLEKIQLKTFSVYQSKKLNVKTWGDSIEDLFIYGSKEIYFEDMKTLSNLRKLFLTKFQTENLNGIGSLTNLEELEINYCSKLKDISALGKCKKLKKVYFESTKKIADFLPLTTLTELKDLTLFNCGDVASLAFIKDIPSLERLLFTDTNIVDGDLTPCLRLKTAWSSFGKRHYNIKVEDLPRGK